MKRIIITVENKDNEIIVGISYDGNSPKEVKQFLNDLNLTNKQKIKYNKDIGNCIKEFKLDMSKCSVEIEKNNKIWEEKINEILLEQENKFKEQENKFKEQEKKINTLQKVLKDNEIDFEF
ncbi:hypothetical protein [Spiroplasma floricola]|uniref:Uncharacterized protein n=1 Tax=Spiroplasma floricola 23-6 TaxID=1336749 RepID=A0A2K8SEY2_9MOLU|nr:hypothetical protein [Spiroplasma floricola]AUB32006.1 hypothetical protein SFLOR_v1c09580 [Spiroplasma floricola 23-6]